jgi:hypothetical protein
MLLDDLIARQQVLKQTHSIDVDNPKPIKRQIFIREHLRYYIIIAYVLYLSIVKLYNEK